MMFRARHLLGVEQLSPPEITTLLDLAETYVALNRRTVKHGDALQGLTQINLFFEASTRTQSSFELAGKRLGADVMNMAVAQSSVKKGETLIDTALTLNAMQPDLLVARRSDFTERDLPQAPILAVEVSSPSTRLFDLNVKKARFDEAGIEAYWVVDPDVPRLRAWERRDGELVQVADVSDEEAFTTTVPFPVEVRPSELRHPQRPD